MSSSDEALSWADFAERPVTSRPVGLVSPAKELLGVLQQYRDDVNAAEERMRDAVGEVRQVAVEQANFVAQLAQVVEQAAEPLAAGGNRRLHSRLRVLKDQMLEALAEGGITVVDPLGEPFDKVADMVDVLGWRHGPEFESEVVARTDEAVVLFQGAVIRPGRVVMGAPPQPTAAPEGAAPPGIPPEAVPEDEAEPSKESDPVETAPEGASTATQERDVNAAGAPNETNDNGARHERGERGQNA